MSLPKVPRYVGAMQYPKWTTRRRQRTARAPTAG
jgi:hypothetical protein